MTTFLNRLVALLRRRRLENELDDELRFHLEMETEENIRRGMSAEEARYAARRSFGGIEQTREAWRDRRFLPEVDAWARDLRHGARMLARSPLFTAFAVVSLALGIGANTAIFTVLHALVLRPLPYPEPQGLMKLWETSMWRGQAGWTAVSVPNLLDWREQNRAFEEIAAFTVGGVNLAGRGETLRVPAAQVEAEVFPALRIRPLLGRTILAEDRDVVVLSHGLWVRRFGANPAIIGQTVAINGAAHMVIGVMPAEFQFPPRSGVELWTPLVFNQYTRGARGSHWLEVIARLRPGVSQTTAQHHMDAIAQRIGQQYPEHRIQGVLVQPLHGETVQRTAQVLLVLFGAAGLVLLLACANVAHLVLARIAGQRRELAVRAALGAGRWGIVRLLMTESLLLAAAGGIAGLFLARQSLHALLALAADRLPAGIPIRIDGAVLWFCVFVSLLCAALAGFIPALGSSRIGLQTALKDAGISRLSPLMVGEVALVLVLVIGALLLVRSLRNLGQFDLGFRPERVLTMKLALPETRTAAQSTAFYRQAIEKARAIPGVSRAAVINLVPVQSSHTGSVFTIDGREPPPPGYEPGAEIRAISPAYFQAMGIPLVAGRSFRPDELPDRWKVALINRYAAEQYFPSEDPIGRRIAYGTGSGREGWRTIVGVVGNVREAGAQSPVPAVIYSPLGHPVWTSTTMSLVLRTSVEPAAVTGMVRRSMRELDPDAAVFLVRTMDQVVADSAADTRLLSRLLTIFSAVALVLAAVGVYGVMSHQVSRSTQEMGVRMALGADRSSVLRLVCRRGLQNALAGILLGLGWATLTNGAMQHYVIGMKAIDAGTYSAAALGTVAVALAASFLPAWRASRVDPAVALRNE
ncbi:MAG: ABC transporter permease [Bryobacteraceae bacterium]|jgi:putative ABC transport system permease protein